MAYPADATLMKKLSERCHKVIAHLEAKKKAYAPKLSIDIEFIRKIAQCYFFLKKTASIEERRELFKRYHRLVKNQLRPAMDLFFLLLRHITLRHGAANQSFAVERSKYCTADPRYRLALSSGRGSLYPSSWHQSWKDFVFSCPSGCVCKKRQGRQSQRVRTSIPAWPNRRKLLIAFTCNSVRMDDKRSLLPAIHEHREIFGETALKQVGADRG